MSREKKTDRFLSLIAANPNPNILDVGSEIGHASYSFIHDYADRQRITSLNLLPEHIAAIKNAYPEVKAQVGDARFLPFPDNHFDVVFSNAVIEHVGDLDDQHRMAIEVMRVGRNWFITTPNRLFPFEFHMRLPFVTWLPQRAMHWLGSRIGFNHIHQRYMSGNQYNVRLITPRELERMFPESDVIRQRVTIMPETLIAVGGEDFKGLAS